MGKVYLKLNPDAGVFYDPTSQTLLRGHEVIALDKMPKAKRVNAALRAGHIQNATEAEYNAYQESLKNPGTIQPAAKKVEDEDPNAKKREALKELGSKKAIVEHFDKDGWTKEDLDLLKALPAKTEEDMEALIEKAIEIDAEYTS